MKILSLIIFKLKVNHDNHPFCSISTERTMLRYERIICYRIRCILSVIYIFVFPKLNSEQFLVPFTV